MPSSLATPHLAPVTVPHAHNPMAPDLTADTLLIGYGNTLRSDDGVGPSIVEAIDQRQILGVRSLIRHQLGPELAADLATVGRVVFVDARWQTATETEARGGAPPRTDDLVQSRRLVFDLDHNLEPVNHGIDPSIVASTVISSHAYSPLSLLALTKLLYNHTVSAWLITILGVNFQLGEDLSPVARLGRHQAIITISKLLLSDGF